MTITDTSINQSWAGYLVSENAMNNAYMVLNDGETYTGLSGCKIVTVEGCDDGDDMDSIIKYGEDDEEYPGVKIRTIAQF